jgi:DNA polymerase-1
VNDRPILFVDAYNVFIRHFVVNPTMNKNGQHVGGAIGFLKGITKVIDSIYPSQVVVVWEGGGSLRRRDIFSNYKNNRRPQKLNRFYEDIPNTVENRNYQISLLIEMIKRLPICQIYVSDCEADDVIGYLSKYRHRKENCVIYSSDKDYYQLMSNNIKVYTPTKKDFVSYDDVFLKFGVHPVNFCTARSFCGDVSDGLPGVKGIGYKTLVKRFPELKSSEFISVSEIINMCHQRQHSSKAKIFNQILSNKEIVKKNWRLMYLDSANLAAKQIDKINYVSDTFIPSSDKIGMMRILSREGLTHFSMDDLFFSLNFILK